MKLRYEHEFEIKGPTCEGCPFFRYFETWDEYKCGAKNDELIDSFAEYPNELRARPDWCPCKIISKK